ncbi:uncharacterized protein PHALS_06113 [Plasmopara halstedii]|uniref:Uncharacterized protein n=1 Tax=Plasmopara halstedii TaxID=4781 RepID=A0A0N7L7X4_PLAHL|nr:uncharacterized protein PHALS_06113 [Plasmopara halstedii]CEG48283.1 hypothetical protein PHALS_06113 [Plasmopara halstedii]|eukprot:XP_024584652.1 hypothetical protein PHALS_06113 [Plasmopara halstedii]
MALTNPCVDHIRALQAASEWLPWESSVLRLEATSLGTAWAAGSIPMEAHQEGDLPVSHRRRPGTQIPRRTPSVKGSISSIFNLQASLICQ